MSLISRNSSGEIKDGDGNTWKPNGHPSGLYFSSTGPNGRALTVEELEEEEIHAERHRRR